jgi:hypothetical protein
MIGAIKSYGVRNLQGKAPGTFFFHLMVTLGVVGYGMEYYAFGRKCELHIDQIDHENT